MLTEERRKKILDYVSDEGNVTVASICTKLDISESTARRDLTALDRQGKLIKVHGGAVRLDGASLFGEPDVEQKEDLFTEEKDLIARYAASTVRKDDLIYIDAGTTTSKMIDYLPHYNITVVTNSFTHAKKLAKKGFRVFIPGGEVKASTEAIIGAQCVFEIGKFNFTKCYMGTNGISVQGGFSTPDINEAEVKRAAVGKSYLTYILADSSKFDRVSAVTFAPLKAACVITDCIKNDKYEKHCIIKEVSK